MNVRKIFFLSILLTCIYACEGDLQADQPSKAQPTEYQSSTNPVKEELFERLRIKDSLLFEFGFKQCDTNLLKNLISDNFEFYHDQSGVTDTKKAFMNSIVGLCNLDYKPIRKLDLPSLQVDVLRNNGEVYGAIQQGKHQFYAKEADKPIYLTSTADFIHLWILENNVWKLKRVLSYNHQSPER